MPSLDYVTALWSCFVKGEYSWGERTRHAGSTARAGNECCSQRPGGRARDSVCWGIFADGCCAVAASKQRCAPQITEAESKNPKIPQQSCLLLALPRTHLWGPCLDPVCCHPPALRALPSHSRGCEDTLRPTGFPLPQDTDSQPGWGLSDTQNVMPLQRWQPWNWLKKINIPHHTSEMWPREMLLLAITGVGCGHSFRAPGWW